MSLGDGCVDLLSRQLQFGYSWQPGSPLRHRTAEMGPKNPQAKPPSLARIDEVGVHLKCLKVNVGTLSKAEMHTNKIAINSFRALSDSNHICQPPIAETHKDPNAERPFYELLASLSEG